MVRRTAVGAAALVAVLGLTGCTVAAQDDAAPTNSASRASSPPAAEPIELPRDCTDVVAASDYSGLFGDTPLNDPTFDVGDRSGLRTPTTPTGGSSLDEQVAAASILTCLWMSPSADITQLSLTLGRVGANLGDSYFNALPAQGYTCSTTGDGRQCSLVTQRTDYPVTQQSTAYLRDGVVISLNQINFPADGLLGKVVARIWH